jgi:hypothetical protein
MVDFNDMMSIWQTKWREKHLSNQTPGSQNKKTRDWILARKSWTDGLWPGLAVADHPLIGYLRDKDIQEHQGVHNLKSSWVFCANLYFPFGRDESSRELLAGFLRSKGIPEIRRLVQIELEYEDPSKDLSPRILLGEPADGKRGANQTSPDLGFTVETTTGGIGLILTENKFTEHSFYGCSGRKENPGRSRCLDFGAVKADPKGQCHQLQWSHRKRRYWEYLSFSKEADTKLTRCPAATAGYQLFRQQALAEAIARSGKYEVVISSVAYDERNVRLLSCLRATGMPDLRNDWGPLFAGKARFATFSHQAWVQYVRGHAQSRLWEDWLSYVVERYGL